MILALRKLSVASPKWTFQKSFWDRYTVSLHQIRQMRKRGIIISDKYAAFLTNPKPPQMYRIVGEEEYQALMRGETIHPRKHILEKRIDITSNPNYGRVSRAGKYLITFNISERFDPLAQRRNSGVIVHNINRDEFYLKGSYSIDDIQEISKLNVISAKALQGQTLAS